MNDTFYAPAFRASQEKIYADFALLKNAESVQLIINAIPEVVAILNKERQIVFGNKVLLNFLGMLDEKECLGLRLGEAVHCINSGIMEAGCGTSQKCRYCGAINAIMESQKSNEKASQECRITTLVDGKHEFLDLQITSSPFLFQQQEYYILSIEDISDSKRRSMLERIFFHDIINIAGGLKGVSELLSDSGNLEEKDTYIGMVDELSSELLDEIMSQRALAFAESNELSPVFIKTNSLKVLEETITFLTHHSVANSKEIRLDKLCTSVQIDTDPLLLKRVLVNMLKNALEATDPGGVVALSCAEENGFVEFSIHNGGYMSESIQAQVFQRSFSTKGNGRGLGTYSIKLLTERYLNGTVGFHTSLVMGTTFMVRLPIHHQ